MKEGWVKNRRNGPGVSEIGVANGLPAAWRVVGPYALPSAGRDMQFSQGG